MFERVNRRRVEAPSGCARPTIVVQRKLRVGAARDQWEIDADRVVDAVMRRLSTPAESSEADAPDVSRRAAPTGYADRAGGFDLDTGAEREIVGARGQGRSLEPTFRSKMEEGFDTDFGAVRVHTDTRADRLNRSLSSEAFTNGSDIFFRAGMYQPSSGEGSRLLAHELTHTIQQGAVPSSRISRRSGISSADADSTVAAREGRISRRSGMSSADADSTVAARGSRISRRSGMSSADADSAEAARGSRISRRTTTRPDAQVQAFFGKKKAKAPPQPAAPQQPAAPTPTGKVVPTLYANLAKALHDAEAGTGSPADLARAGEQIPAERAAIDLGAADAGDRYSTLDYLEAEISDLVGMFAQAAATKQQAKDIYLEAGRKSKKEGGLEALAPLNKHFKGSKSSAKKVGKKYGLDRAEIKAVSTYTADDYKYINPAVAFNDKWMASQMAAGQRGTQKQRLEEGGLHAGMIMAAFAKLPAWAGTGYRGERLTPAEFKQQFSERKGKVTARTPTSTKSAFWSVSTKEVKSQFFASTSKDAAKTVSVMYYINVSNARDVSKFSNFPEAEVLCPPGSAFTVSKVEKSKDGKAGVPKATAWYKVYLDQTK